MTFLEITGPGGQIETRELSKVQPLAIGSHRGNDVCIPEAGAAPLHCRISWNRSGYEVTSATGQGVSVNGVPRAQTSLQSGDRLSIGGYELLVRTIGERTQGQPRERSAAAGAAGRGTRAVAAGGLAAAPVPAEEEVLEAELIEDDEFGAPSPTKRAAPVPAKGPAAWWRRLRQAEAVRPGEQELLRSPLVVTVGGVSLLLFLAALTFWFMIGRDTANRRYDRAVAELNSGKHTQAIRQFQEFVALYPRHELAEPARVGMGKARIEKEIAGATPAWSRGLEALEQFVDERRDAEGFSALQKDIRSYAERIALGAAGTAQASRQRELLDVAQEASTLMVRFSPTDDPPVEAEARIREAVRQAEAAIRKQETLDAAVAEIQKALAAREPLAALAARRDLIERYAEFASHRAMATALASALEVERELVARDDDERDASERPRLLPEHAELTLALHSRPRTDEGSSGRVVFALAKDCCYGVDSVTGDPLWKRVVGFDAPFFPVPIVSSVSGLLVFDTYHQELVLVLEKSGGMVWRQPIEGGASGPPLVHEGQVYLATGNSQLLKLDLETGRITSRLTFSQPVHGPPALMPDGTTVLVAGEQELLYTLSMRPLACRRVTYSGHKPSSIRAPLLPMGRLLLSAENDQASSSRLRVFQAADSEEPLVEVAALRIAGHVLDRPVLRGRELFVPSAGERITAFSVTDEEGRPPLSFLASYQVPDGYGGPLYLAAGADNQLWMASTAFRKFELGADTIRIDPNQVSVGLASQPLQQQGASFFIGRRLPYSDAVIVTQADRDRMVNQWRTVLGASLLSLTGEGSAVVALNEAGHLFRVRPETLEQGGFLQSASIELALADSLSEPLKATDLGDGRVAAHVAGREPRLWVFSANQVAELDLALEQPLETNPVRLGSAVVLPLPGRLRVQSLGRGGSAIEDYIAPTGADGASPWVQLGVLGEGELIALDAQARLRRIQLRTEGVAHLAEVASVALMSPPATPFAVADEQILVAEGTRLRALDGRSLEAAGELTLDAAVTAGPWVAGSATFVECGRSQLVSLRLSPELKQEWTSDLGDEPLAGAPLPVDDRLYVACRSGTVLLLDPETGRELVRAELGQPLTHGPRRLGNGVVVATVDGSLHRIDALLTGGTP